MTRERILTAVVLIPLVVAIVWLAPTWGVAVLAGGVVGLALFEFFDLCARAAVPGYPRWTIFCALWIIVAQWAASGADTLARSVDRSGNVYPAPPILEWLLPPEFFFGLFILGAAAIALYGRLPPAAALPGTAASAAGLLFVALPLSYLVRLHGLGSTSPTAEDRLGPKALLFTLCLIWVGDSVEIGRASCRERV